MRPSSFRPLIVAIALLAGGCMTPRPVSATRDAQPLRQFLDQARTEAGLPALAIAVADGDRILFSHVGGTRTTGGSERVRDTDSFHIGSITKPVTATMIARLVEANVLQWTTTPADIWPEHAARMDSRLRQVTLAQLLSHRSGLPSFETDVENASFPRQAGERPPQERQRFAMWLLARPPQFHIGEHHYSNAGYGVAGAMAERASGRSWEELVRREVFRPLGMRGCGFGWPVEDGPAPSGHYLREGRLTRHDLRDHYRLRASIAPAGDIHCPATDLARFGQAHLNGLHLNGLHGASRYLAPATFRKLHEAADGDYALGWNIRRFGSQHLGSAGTFFGSMIVFRSDRLVTVLLANATVLTTQQVSTIMSRVYRHFRPAPVR